MKPGEQIRELLGKADRPVVWFWGHDHRLVIYNKFQNGKGPVAYGRCIGHGGLPVEIQMPDPLDIEKVGYYDRRVRKILKGHPLGYNGFVRLLIKDELLTAEYRDLEDTCVFEECWRINKSDGQLTWKVVQAVPELAVR